MENIKVYERQYDNPFNHDGSKKPNKLLGVFEIVQIIRNEPYAAVCIGRRISKNSGFYLIEEKEVSFFNSGAKYVVTKLNVESWKE